MHVSEFRKAIVGALIAALSVLAGAVGDGVSAEEWITTAVAFLTGLGVVYAVPNRAPSGVPADPDLSEQDGRDDGYGLVEVLVAAFFAVLIVYVVLRLL